MVPDITPRPQAPASRAIPARRLASDVNLPNLITLARLLAVPAAIWLILAGRHAAAFWVFVAAGLSDALDGYIAKRFNRRTPLGALLDPAADKALLTGVYLTLGFVGHLPMWLVCLVVLRDLLIVAGYLVLRKSAAVSDFDPLYISKINTLVQIAVVGLVLGRLGLGIEAGWETSLLIGAAAVTTVLSGLSYLVRCWRMLAGTERGS